MKMVMLHKRIGRVGSQRREDGFVSIMATMIIMIVLTLIVIAFATAMRRESRASLDRQISTQAFYAAESGVSDALFAFKSGYNTDKPNCTTWASPPPAGISAAGLLSNKLDVSYSCLLIDFHPTTLIYKPTVGHSQVGLFHDADGIESLTFGWQATNNAPKTFWPNLVLIQPNLPTPTVWNGLNRTGMLRLDVTPINGAAFTRTDLVNNTKTYFLYPTQGGGFNVISNALITEGSVLKVLCNAATNPNCFLQVNNLGGQTYLVRMSAIYDDITVNVLGLEPLGTPVEFSGSQAVVDSTGRVTDVLRRIQVNVPLNGDFSGIYPDFDAQSASTLCKKLDYIPAPDFQVFVDPTDPSATGNIHCDPGLGL